MNAFLNLLGYVVVVGLIAIIIYGTWSENRDTAKHARKKALDEAAAALRSMADVAGDAVESRRREGLSYTVAADRAYYFQRAASIVASIPVERL